MSRVELPVVESDEPPTSFGRILRRVVQRVPGATGAVFVDWEGEAIDQWGASSALDLKLAAAHWSIIYMLAHERIGPYGGPPLELWVESVGALILVRRVTEQYHVVLTAQPTTHLTTARRELEQGAQLLLEEM